MIITKPFYYICFGLPYRVKNNSSQSNLNIPLARCRGVVVRRKHIICLKKVYRIQIFIVFDDCRDKFCRAKIKLSREKEVQKSIRLHAIYLKKKKKLFHPTFGSFNRFRNVTLLLKKNYLDFSWKFSERRIRKSAFEFMVRKIQ